MKKVVAFQAYIPEYRVPLFELVRELLASDRIDFIVAAGCNNRQGRVRGDASWVSGATPTKGFEVHLQGGPIVTFQSAGKALRETSLLILPFAGSALHNYPLALRYPFLLWGHGPDNYTGSQYWLDTVLETWLLRRSRGFLAYTPRGAKAVVSAGMSPSSVHTLFNTIDTRDFVSAKNQLGQQAIIEFRKKYELTDHTVAFIGALDDMKRLDVALRSMDQLRGILPDLRFMIAGDGPLRSQVENYAANRDWCSYIGRALPFDKALLASSIRLLLNPGAVGLVAVDSLIMGTPIATLKGKHGPEIDYLDESDCLFSEDEAHYVADVHALLLDEGRRSAMASKCLAESSKFKIELMAERFADAVRSGLS